VARQITIKVVVEGASSGAVAAVKAVGSALSGLAGFGASVFGGLNQAMELGRKALDTLRLGWEMLLAPALKFRDANDAGRRTMEAFEGSALRARVAIGDALLPVITGTIEALGLANDAIERWLKANRTVIGLKIADAMAAIGGALIDGVAFGAIWASRAVTGIVVAFNSLRIGANEALRAVINTYAAALDGAAKYAAFMGEKGAARALKQEAEDLRLLGKAMGEVSKDFGISVGEMLADQDALETKIRGHQSAGSEALGKVVAAVRNAVAEQVRSNAVLTDAEKARVAAEEKAAQSRIERARAAIDAQRALQDAQAKLNNRVAPEIDRDRGAFDRELEAYQARQAAAERYEQKQAEIAQRAREMSSAMASSVYGVGRELLGIATSAESAGDAIWGITKRLLEMVAERAALSLLERVFSFATAGGSDVVGGIFGFLGSIFGGSRGGEVRGYALGGRVFGGVTGDTVPALLMPGEVVISRASVEQSRRTGQVPRELATSGVGGGGRSGGNVTLNLGVQLPYLPSSAEATTALDRALGPWLRRQRALGRV